jgi:hypothetical protein
MKHSSENLGAGVFYVDRLAVITSSEFEEKRVRSRMLERRDSSRF